MQYNNHYIDITYIIIEKIKIKSRIILLSIAMTNMKLLFIITDIMLQ